MLHIVLAISLVVSVAAATSSARAPAAEDRSRSGLWPVDSARARFGRSDAEDGSSSDSDSAKRAYPAVPALAPCCAEARPPRDVDLGHRAPRVDEPPPRPVVLAESRVDDAVPPMVSYAPAPFRPSVVAPARFEAGVEGQGHRQGGTLGFLLRLERGRLGIHSEYALIFAGGQDEVDAIGLFDAHLTYALLVGERGRLRVEAGIDCASAPELKVVGPDAGASAGLRLLGPLGVEVAAYFTPVPFRRLDARASATLTFGHLALRAGLKTYLLDDAGLGDGNRHVDAFTGPYGGLALVF